MRHGVGEELPGLGHVARVECRPGRRDQFVRRALPFGQCAAGPFDVGAGTAVAAFEERHARPDVDGFFVAAGEILIEARQEQLLDAGGTVAIIDPDRRSVCRVGRSPGL